MLYHNWVSHISNNKWQSQVDSWTKSFRCDKSSINMAWMWIIESKCSTYSIFHAIINAIRTFKLFCYARYFCTELNWCKRSVFCLLLECLLFFFSKNQRLNCVLACIDAFDFRCRNCAPLNKGLFMENSIWCRISSTMRL